MSLDSMYTPHHTLTEIGVKMTVWYRMWLIMYPRVRIPCAGNTILGKLSVIREQNVTQKVYP
jgi:hypothetical protein